MNTNNNFLKVFHRHERERVLQREGWFWVAVHTCVLEGGSVQAAELEQKCMANRPASARYVEATVRLGQRSKKIEERLEKQRASPL